MAIDKHTTRLTEFLVPRLGGPPVALGIFSASDVNVEVISLEIRAGRLGPSRVFLSARKVGDLVVEERYELVAGFLGLTVQPVARISTITSPRLS